MAVDLKTNSFFRRISLVLEPDALVKLEHDRTKDRVRKIMFDRVDQVIVWRRLPVLRIILVTAILCAPGALLLMTNEPVGIVIAFILLAIGLIVDAVYLYYRKTTIRIIRAGRAEDITGIFRPRKVRTLVANMQANIRATQAAGFARLNDAPPSTLPTLPTPPAP